MSGLFETASAAAAATSAPEDMYTNKTSSSSATLNFGQLLITYVKFDGYSTAMTAVAEQSFEFKTPRPLT
jgi:hypothetical protein